MSGMPAKQAQTLLEKQLDILSEVRNAGTRATEFREWRQTTLTCIERIWPEQGSRATRFRRIAFSPSTAKADDKVTRDAFERGCAEARRLLKLWASEIETKGITQEVEAPRLAEAVRQTLVERKPAPPPEVPTTKLTSKPPPKNGRKAKKPELGEMLGLAPPGARPELPPEFEAMTEGRGGKAADKQKRLDPSDRLADALALSIDHALERAKAETKRLPRALEPIDSLGRNNEPLPAFETRTLVSYVARSFITMAADIEELGVPEGHRERVRLALLDLAHHVDCGSITWELMRDAVTLVMHYPRLGRQAVPLLLPFLDNAA